jgi:flagellar hook-length control protein FliK
VATTITEPAQPGSPAATDSPLRSDGNTDKAKAAQPGRTEHAAAPARSAPANAPAPQSADSASDVQDKPAAPAMHQHEPAAEHSAAAHPATEARDVAPPNTASANAGTPTTNLAAPALPTAVLWPMTALRVGAAPDVAVPVTGLAVEIVSRAQDGLKRFDIRLDPPDLGRIDVRLDVHHDGRVTSRLIVERVETLDLLRRDAPALERALQNAGLKTDGGIDFSLRDQSFREQAPRDNAPTTRLIVPDDEPAATEAALRGYGRLIGLGGGVDIRV